MYFCCSWVISCSHSSVKPFGVFSAIACGLSSGSLFNVADRRYHWQRESVKKLPNLFKNSSTWSSICFRAGVSMRYWFWKGHTGPVFWWQVVKAKALGLGVIGHLLPLWAQLQTSSGRKQSCDSISKINYVTSNKTHRVPPALPSYVSFHVFGRKGKRIANYLEWFILQQRMEIKSVWELGTGRTENTKAAERQLWNLVYFDSKSVRSGYHSL